MTMTELTESEPSAKGKPGVFGLYRKEDPNTLLAIHTREDVCEDLELAFGARLLFTRLLDLALNPNLYNGSRGQIIVSIMQLSERLGSSERTIERWIKQLVSKRIIWISKVFRPNTKPINCYHITAFQPAKKAEQEIPGDGLWGNGYRRSDDLGLGVLRGRSGQFVGMGGGLVDVRGNPLSSYLLEKTAGRRQKVLLSAVTHDGSQASQVALSAVTHDGSQASPVTVESRQPCRLTGATGDGGEGSLVSDLKESQNELESPFESSTSNVQRANASNRRQIEREFLMEVREVMDRWQPGFGKKELESSGAWWRMVFRENPRKTRAVLADIKAGIVEHREFTENPGAAAVYLYKSLP
jgi:hypothetical protein